ncbi:aldolase [Piedraia hortae CBS 480.64]|uniref:Aldolase n=1 Tax=Piedraia hortae CBS 480.64 TaxID=1314780 RepID=A0A6A7BR35_9PEZI|nr:aldolase [Piedraia hortae CBS 480.64]
MTVPPKDGIYVPVPTFFKSTANGATALDTKTQSAHTLRLADAGVSGILLLGSTGEAVSVSLSERRELIASQRDTLDKARFPDVPIIAGTAAYSPEDTIEALHASSESGAKYALVLSPGYFAGSTTQQGIQKWFEHVADNSPIAIMIYHFPGVTNNLYIDPKTFEALAKHRNIVGTKLSHGIMDDVTLIAASPGIDHEKFKVFTGLGQMLLPVMSVGGAGGIDALANIFPKLLIRLFKLSAETGANAKQTRELQYHICRGEKLVAKYSVVGVKEALSRVWGVGDQKTQRLPVARLEDSNWSEWEQIFKELKQIEETC